MESILLNIRFDVYRSPEYRCSLPTRRQDSGERPTTRIHGDNDDFPASAYLSGSAAASGIALIGALGNLGGFLAPTLKTAIESGFHSEPAGMVALAIAGGCGGLLLLSIGTAARRSFAIEPGSSGSETT